MSEDHVHYESCGECNIIDTVNSVKSTNEVVTITNVYDEGSCDESDSFVSFDTTSETEIVDDSTV